jgi:hypothetical protein
MPAGLEQVPRPCYASHLRQCQLGYAAELRQTLGSPRMPTDHTASGALIAGSAQVAMSSPPRQFLDRARGLLSGLEALALLGPQQAEAAIFLASWCLELTLKAHLESKGQTKDKLWDIRHNLAELWAEASGHGLPVPATPPRWCVLLGTTHDGPLFHQRYPTDAAASSAPNIQLLVVELTALHNLVAQSLQ